MSGSKIETTIGLCVVALTRHIMEVHQLSYENAYRHLLKTELFSLLQDEETRLYLETNSFLCTAYDKETVGGKDALYAYINDYE